MKSLCYRNGLWFVLLPFLLVIKDSKSQHEIKVLVRSPNSTYLVQGESLELNVTVNITSTERYFYRDRIRWHFRPFLSRSYKQVASRHMFHDHSDYYGDTRFSFVNKASLLLVNTTLNDSGTYRMTICCWSFQEFFFNATIVDKPKIEITCPSRINLTETVDLSCWCKANEDDYPTMVSWFRNGKEQGDPVKFSKEIFLGNVSKRETGTYSCRVQLYTFISDEKTTEIVVNYSPRIDSFQLQISLTYNYTKLLCVADGFPEPSYVIHDFAGKKLSGVNNGEVVIGNFCEINNTFYTCIASNNLGQDQRRLNIEHYPFCEVNNGVNTQLKESKSSNKNHQWYLFIITFIVGAGIGVGLTILIPRIIRRIQKTKETGERTDYNDTMTTSPSSDGQPGRMEDSSSDHYAELGTIKEPAHIYMDLHMTSRMKAAARH